MEPRDPAGGQISPELVLVDPELAARARAALPDHPWPAPVRIEPATRRRRLSIPVAPTFSILSLAAFAAILGVSFLPTRDQPTFAAQSQPILTGAPPPPAAATPPPAAAGKRSHAKKLRTARRRVAASPTAPGQLGRFEPARTFVWVARASAVYYRVLLVRKGRRFYEARTRATRLTLPRRLQFRSGIYRWTVRPAIRSHNGTRLGDPIVDSTFRIGRA